MKTLYKYIIGMLLGAMLIVYSCDESNLDLKPFEETEASYFTEEEHFTRAVYGIYAKMVDLYYFNSNSPIGPMWLCPGDDITTNGSYPYETFNGLQPGDYLVNEYWDGGYGIINRADIVLEKIDEEDGVYQSPGLKATHRGEALFMRALWHFRLANFFGDIPLMMERVNDLDKAKPGETPYLEVISQCISDLEEAAQSLPNSWDNKNLGRATKDAAYGLMGKCYVFRACYGDNPDADYQNAVDAFNNITTRELMPHFGDNFDVEMENNKESLFEFQASNAPSMDNIWLWNDFNVPIGSLSAYYGFFSDTWSFWAHTPLMPSEKLQNTFEEGDPRIHETYKDNDGANFNPLNKQFLKYVKRDNQGDVTTSLNNPRILRYADVLLLKAEAQLQLNETDEATDLVNMIRERARNSVPDTVTTPSPVPADLGSVSMQDIMDERLRELAGEEAHRWFDLKRWDAAGYIDLSTWGINEFSSVRSEDFKFDYPDDLLYPIPTNETDYNPNITQNPGY
jgi:hypothetical protein